MAKKKSITTILEGAAKEPAVRVAAASAAVAGGAVAGKLVHDGVERTQRRKERRYRLDPAEPGAEGIKRVLAGQLDGAIELLSEDGAAGSAEAIHDARKALKRGRAALRLSRQLLGRSRYRQANHSLRDAGRTLSDLRDAQVLLETLDGLTTTNGFGPLREALIARVEPGGDGAQPRGDAARAALPALEEARCRVESWALDGAGPPARLGEGFERIYRRGRRALRVARRDPSVENLHELRKRSKDLWHSAQLLRELSPTRADVVARRAHRLSDLLGEDHDLAILHEHAHSETALLEPSEQELLERLIKRRRKQLRRQALSCAARLYRRKPRKQMRRLALA